MQLMEVDGMPCDVNVEKLAEEQSLGGLQASSKALQSMKN